MPSLSRPQLSGRLSGLPGRFKPNGHNSSNSNSSSTNNNNTSINGGNGSNSNGVTGPNQSAPPSNVPSRSSSPKPSGMQGNGGASTSASAMGDHKNMSLVLRAKVMRGRNLAAKDKSGTSDPVGAPASVSTPFCHVSFGASS
ncbi:hypothetical protein LTS18_010435, partial [Coniosporium uncinatum]